MSALEVTPPFPVFSDIDGQPLENGYIWIGAVNLNPQTNPINVYWDSSLTISATQPIRTLGGYPSNSSLVPVPGVAEKSMPLPFVPITRFPVLKV